MAFWKPAPSKHTEPSAPAVAPRVKPALVPTASTKSPAKGGRQIADKNGDDSAKKSFDPYNSGAFDTRQTWERVIRK